MEFSFRDVLDRAAAVGRDVELADVYEIFRHGGPGAGADPEELDAFRRRVDIPQSYADFLTYCDGWLGFDGHTDMFTIAEVLGGPAVEEAWQVVEAYDEGSDRQFGLSRDRYLVIGAAASVLSVVLLDLVSPPRVCLLAGGGVEEFPDLEAFMVDVIEIRQETLAELRADPWLGLPDQGGPV
ncbi:MAG TPA: hypothetical protein VN408_23685 [Actinoplanes sp.]|nr:hypothetical protein [Actinoplanes sp.]